MHNHGVRPDRAVVPEFDVTEQLRTSTDHYAVTDRGVSLAALMPRASECDAVIDQYIVTDDRCFTDHHAHTVVNEEATPDRGARVDFDTCEKPG